MNDYRTDKTIIAEAANYAISERNSGRRAYECIGATRFCISRHRDGSVTFGVESAGLIAGWSQNEWQTIRLEPDDDLLAISEAFALIAKGGKLQP